LGNLVARVAKLAEKSGFEAAEKVDHFDPEVEKLLTEFKFNEALNWIWKIVQRADQRVNETQPWKLQGTQLKEVLDELVSLILDAAYNLQPFLPETSEKILKQFSGKVASQTPLFPRI
jgi:methionyl-tRNA synthetase